MMWNIPVNISLGQRIEDSVRRTIVKLLSKKDTVRKSRKKYKLSLNLGMEKVFFQRDVYQFIVELQEQNSCGKK